MDRTPGERTAGAVRAELARRQLSGRDLAKALGWSFTTTSRRLNGSYPFDIDELVAVADYLGLSPADLLPEGEPAA